MSRCWTVRSRADGSVTVDGEGERDLDPPPVTTIAWRLWHIGVDCLDAYSERLLGADVPLLRDLYRDRPVTEG